MRAADLSGVRAYWEALRAGALVPARAQVDPRGIESALDIAFLAERIAPGQARLRIAGMRLNDLMCMEVRGMPLSALILPDSRQRFADALEQVFAGPAIVELALRAPAKLGLAALDARMLLLPLRDEIGQITRALGALALQGRVGATTRRLDVLGVQVNPLRPLQAADAPDVPPPAPASNRTPEPGFAEPPAPFAAPPRKRPRLRLIRNDED